MPRSHARSEAAGDAGTRTVTVASRGSRTVRRRTLRIAAAGLTAAAALTLTACGGQDNPLKTSAAKPFNPSPQVAAASAGQGEEAGQGGTGTDGGRSEGGRTEQVYAERGGNGTGTDAGTKTTGTGSRRAATSPNASARVSAVRHTACDAAKIRIVAERLTRPVNHLLLKATNTSGAVCDLYYSPYLRFDQAQSPLAELPASRPQSVVTLAPGESGYAGVLTSSADGSGGNGRTVTSLTVSLPGRDGKGSIGGSAAVALPGGSVHLDDSAWVTYWQSDANDAAAW
ncbi:Protein of unknown function [Streptomyces sp. 2224.1]|uniref:DUF4232 domain-containing protein n=1 Tax=unclassified Streptomyces TaxID=2593676 RepID=UPI0008881E03|nr:MULTISPECIES: DUF4232 domain-containing protein [unclassified Streptomyces]PBC83571.1 uncharacterized protein DUF4232 [Streptomyces sp. 2321.6]SDR41079.1 Protein of unknown function [Streptomyces sp. KS_16]SEC02077.1 Protein of unknown function [Streptomyces sp. 2224.1]SED00956.1 Protein of unknown function [Streptomyces sp. 2133.1]SNC69649.1 Protein of unknown function [Streptomyces sp. 2114.4]